MTRPPAESPTPERAPLESPSTEQAIADPAGYGNPSVGARLARRVLQSGRRGVGQPVDAEGTRFVVGTVDEIPPGQRKVVLIEGREIGVFNVNGEYFAVLNRCPHQGGPLCGGRQTGFLRSPTPGQFELSRPGEVIRCPWHGWEFDLRTGQSWCEPSRVRVRRYDVTVQPGAAIAQPGASEPATVGSAASDTSGTAPTRGPRTGGTVPTSGPGARGQDSGGQDPSGPGTSGPGTSGPGMEGLVKGPYVAETYPVSVEQQYVVVELGGRSTAP